MIVSRLFKTVRRVLRRGKSGSADLLEPTPGLPDPRFTVFKVGRHEKDDNTVTVNFRFADDVGRAAMPQLDVVILLDASDSMREEYQQGQVQALFEAVLRYLLPYDADGITVILFAAQSAHYVWPEPVCNLKQIPAIIQQGLQMMVDSTHVAEALQTALKLKKANGSVLVEILTDGAFDDPEAVVALISQTVEHLVAAQPDLSLPAAQSRLQQSRQYHIHITGLGLNPESRQALKNLDDNLGLPFDMVDFSPAENVLSAPEEIFQELDRSALTVGDNGLVSVRGPISVTGVGDGTTRVYETEDIELDPESPSQVVANFYGWEKMPAAGQVAVQFAGDPEPFELTLAWQGDQVSIPVVP